MAPAAKPTTKAKGGLGKKVGPLPVWAWGVLVLALVAFFFLRSRNAAASGGDAGSGPLATGGGSGGGGGASGDSGTDPNVIPVGVGDQKTEPGGESSAVGDGTTQSADQTFQAVNTSTPTSSFGDVPVAGLPANAPVYNVPSAPGSDALIQGPYSHPQALSGATTIGSTGLAVAVPNSPNYAALNTPTGANAHRPGFQL